MELIFWIDSIRNYVADSLCNIADLRAFLLFCPLVLYEILRYCVPLIFVGLLEMCGFSRSNPEAEAEFIARNPFISIVIAGRNESEVIGSTIESLLALPYENREIIIVDDNSDDNMYEICRPYAERGLIKLFRNSAPTGRGGRAIASNFGLRMAKGEFIISLDADTSYDYDIVQQIIGPFHDPKVGVVAGNLKVLNLHENIWTVCQAIEYAVSIGMWKRWTSLMRVTMQASGAFGAFRHDALRSFYGWDPELAEDADLSLKMRKIDWDIAFAPGAIAMTHVPPTLKGLIKQRVRWDKGTLRTYFHKHGDLMKPWRGYSLRFTLEMLQEFFVTYILSLTYLGYTAFLLVYDWRIWVFAVGLCYFVYTAMTYLVLLPSIFYSERRKQEYFMLLYVPFFPLYKEIFRWVRTYANICETFRWKYKESYIPPSGYLGKPW